MLFDAVYLLRDLFLCVGVCIGAFKGGARGAPPPPRYFCRLRIFSIILFSANYKTLDFGASDFGVCMGPPPLPKFLDPSLVCELSDELLLQRQDRHMLNLCIPMMPFTPGLSDLVWKASYECTGSTFVLSLSYSGVKTPLEQKRQYLSRKQYHWAISKKIEGGSWWDSEKCSWRQLQWEWGRAPGDPQDVG